MSTSSPFFIVKPQVKTRGWDKQPILIPPQLSDLIHKRSMYGNSKDLLMQSVTIKPE
jgi:hypothetical protein